MLSICTQCQQHMVNHLETLINIIISTEDIDMPSDASTELLKGISCNYFNDFSHSSLSKKQINLKDIFCQKSL